MAFSFGGLSRVKGTATRLFMQTTGEPKQLAATSSPSAGFEEMKNKLQRMRVSHVIAGL